jgi:hypothetical protein
LKEANRLLRSNLRAANSSLAISIHLHISGGSRSGEEAEIQRVDVVPEAGKRKLSRPGLPNPLL